MYAILIQLYANDPPREDGNFRIHSLLFKTQEEAQEYIDSARRNNLPFKTTKILRVEEV